MLRRDTTKFHIKEADNEYFVLEDGEVVHYLIERHNLYIRLHLSEEEKQKILQEYS